MNLLNIVHVDGATSRQEYEDEDEEYYYYDYEPESSCPPGELKVQVVFSLLWRWSGGNYSILILIS